MRRKPAVPGEVYGYWTVIRDAKNASGLNYWLCKCRCGTERIVAPGTLVRGLSVSCRCSFKTLAKAPDGTVFDFNNRQHKLTYRCWQSMVQRCENKREQAYADYGARGISVCAAWHDFSAFWESMGLRPDGLSVDRIDNSSGYKPGNCRWATMKQQVANRRTPSTTKLISHAGVTQGLGAWARQLDVEASTVTYRLKHWTVEEALTRPACLVGRRAGR